ncbi:hypothetical protein ABFX02_13G099200 [Erythranthe guttata]
MAMLKFIMWLIVTWLLLLCSAETMARSVKSITIARRELEARFVTVKRNRSHHEWPGRVTPGGPDAHHHFRHL